MLLILLQLVLDISRYLGTTQTAVFADPCKLVTLTQKCSGPSKLICRSETMDFSAVVAKAPQGLLVALAILGLVTASRKVISYVRLLLSLFVLGGKNVGHSEAKPADMILIAT